MVQDARAVSARVHGLLSLSFLETEDVVVEQQLVALHFGDGYTFQSGAKPEPVLQATLVTVSTTQRPGQGATAHMSWTTEPGLHKNQDQVPCRQKAVEVSEKELEEHSHGWTIYSTELTNLYSLRHSLM
ncbi:hypothetical protein ABBQ32_008657 [Trebouxia sp. C0010 RCD-2024]